MPKIPKDSPTFPLSPWRLCHNHEGREIPVEQAVRFLSFRMRSSEVLGNPPFLEMKFFHGLGLFKLTVKGFTLPSPKRA
jgi:hypothetical protein